MTKNLSIFLARRQKRLKYWQERFTEQELAPEFAQRFQQLFKEYMQLIGEAARASDETAQEKACTELLDLDTEITSLFEARRLLTSELGVGAVTDESTRGSGGSIE